MVSIIRNGVSSRDWFRVSKMHEDDCEGAATDHDIHRSLSFKDACLTQTLQVLDSSP